MLPASYPGPCPPCTLPESRQVSPQASIPLTPLTPPVAEGFCLRSSCLDNQHRNGRRTDLEGPSCIDSGGKPAQG
jgi:hypothetical protein